MAELREVGVAITLVHGTFARPQTLNESNAKNRSWIQCDSAFCNELKNELQSRSITSVLEPFLWSGDNSLSARDTASDHLAHFLIEQANKYPEYAQVVIAHSHGGNIALRALKRLTDRGDQITLVSLATPFLSVIEAPLALKRFSEIRSFSRRIAYPTVLILLLYVLWWLGITLPNPNFSFIQIFIISATITLGPATIEMGIDSLMAHLIGEQSQSADVSNKNANRFSNAIASFASLVYAFQPWALSLNNMLAIEGNLPTIISVIAQLVLIGTFARAVSKWTIIRMSPSKPSHPALSKASRLAEMSSGCIPRNLLVLRGIDDEASLLLAAAAISSRTTRTILSPAARVVSWSSIIAVMAIFLRVGLAESAPAFIPPPASTAILFLLIEFGFFCLVLFGALSRYGYGKELFMGAWGCDVNVHSVPDVQHNADVVTLTQSKIPSSMRHSLYQNENCALVIARWVVQQL